MNTLDLKKIVSLSCAGHITAFALLTGFSFSLGSVRPHTPFTPVVFCGSMLPLTMSGPVAVHPVSIQTVRDFAFVPRPAPVGPVSFDYYVKPPAAFSCVSTREPVKPRPIFTDVPKRKDSVLLMHPLLPYQFELYFNDRQNVHIELEFAITRAEDRNFVSLRRKISSGNLEADLLSMRYIEHYLFIQQARFMPSIWQTVKIEFSPHTH